MAKVNEITWSTLMPISRAVGLSNEAARMALADLRAPHQELQQQSARGSTRATMIRKMFEMVIAPSGGVCPA